MFVAACDEKKKKRKKRGRGKGKIQRKESERARPMHVVCECVLIRATRVLYNVKRHTQTDRKT
jgi:hypothetical protein